MRHTGTPGATEVVFVIPQPEPLFGLSKPGDAGPVHGLRPLDAVPYQVGLKSLLGTDSFLFL